MICRCALLAVFVVTNAWADEVSLVRVGDLWRFLKGTAEPSTPPEAWRQVDFDDRAWRDGRSGFKGGASTSYEATHLPDMPGSCLSLYLRRTFDVADPATVKWLVLRVDYEDGFVAYLNGSEIARRGFLEPPATLVPFDAPAAIHLAGVAEEIDVSEHVDLLRQGENVLAIQAHAASLYDLVLMTPELLANFTRGPLVQNAASNHIQVIWKTPLPADSVVDYGFTPELEWRQSDAAVTTNHAVMLTNLLAGTAYYYRVSSTAADQTVASPVETFRTLQGEGPIRFVVFGDTGCGTIAQYDVATVVRASNPDLVLHLGDVVYPRLTDGQVDLKCFSIYQPHMKSVPYYFTMGNHDLYANWSTFYDSFYLPTNAPFAPELYYSFDHGDAHFVMFWLPSLNFHNLDLEVNKVHYNWLTNDLATSTKPWKFLAFHQPLRSSGPHQNDDWNLNGVRDNVDVENAILPVAAQSGVQMIFMAHEHLYERFNPIQGVHCITTGGGGAFLYPLSKRDVANSQLWSTYHCVKVEVEADSLTLEALDARGHVFDSMTLQRTVPPPTTWQAAWHTPRLETAPADDLDGNLNGQRFDFVGTPIPTLPGQFSHLGRFYVNHDATWLYLGIQQAMFYADNDVFVFVESPRQAGVSELTGLGNGTVDPEGQGVDALDFLENLSFRNFAPSLACILGDEFADGQLRSFRRPTAALGGGQGVFHLDQSFTDVAGVRVQQYNRSPQAGGEADEQNANFMEVAIPLAELGGIQPGDRLKIGAVVGGGEIDADSQKRFLDTSCLGTIASGSGQSNVVLTGVTVQLAEVPPPELRLSLAVVGENRYRLTWVAVAGHKYQVEFADGAPIGFAPLADGGQTRIASTNTEIYYLDLSQETPVPTARYFRVRQVP